MKKFLIRLSIIIEKYVESGFGEWSENGLIFHIYDLEKIKPYSVSNFKRQLLYYNFTLKIGSSANELSFEHPKFTRDKKENIQSHKSHKSKNSKKLKKNISTQTDNSLNNSIVNRL